MRKIKYFSFLLWFGASEILYADFNLSKYETLDSFTELKKLYPSILEENTQKVIEITRNRTKEEEIKAIYDNGDITRVSPLKIGPNFNYALGGIGKYWNYFNFPIFLGPTGSITLLTNLIVGIQNTILKNKYHYPRPYVVSDKINYVTGRSYNPNSKNAYLSFPSGHTAAGYANALIMAQIIPERYSELMAAASDFGQSRILLGVHYPLDVIGSRMVVMSQVAFLMSMPWYRALMHLARIEARSSIQLQCHTDMRNCINNHDSSYHLRFTDLYENFSHNQTRFNERINYGFKKITNVLFVVPEKVGWLLFNRFPYLTDEQRKKIIISTAGEAGYPLSQDSSKESWQPINLLEASLGPKVIDGNWVVDMDGSPWEKLISGSDNPYYRSDVWTNSIIGNGKLIKKGKGSLILEGNNHFAGIVILAGYLILNGKNNFSESGLVHNGTLTINGDFVSNKELKIDAKGVLNGSGMIDAPIYLLGKLFINGNHPLHVRNYLKMTQNSYLIPELLTTRGAILAEGKSAIIHLNGILDARNVLPGTLIELENSAGIRGNFRQILQPKFFQEQGFYYSVLQHPFGVNLYINSDLYPSTAQYKGNEKKGAELLIRLQGSFAALQNPFYQFWLLNTLKTGNHFDLPRYINGQIYADIIAYLTSNIFIPKIDSSMLSRYLTGNTYLWGGINIDDVIVPGDQGNTSDNINSRFLHFGLNHFYSPHLMSIHVLTLAQSKLKTLQDQANLNQIILTNSFRLFLKDFTKSGFYLESGVGVGKIEANILRNLGVLGRTNSRLNGATGFFYAKTGYEYQISNWLFEPNISYLWQLIYHHSFTEKDNFFKFNITTQKHLANQFKVGFDFYHLPRKDKISKEWQILPKLSVYDEIHLTKQPVSVEASMQGLKYQVNSNTLNRHSIKMNLGVSLKKNTSVAQVDISYTKSKNIERRSINLKFTYSF